MKTIFTKLKTAYLLGTVNVFNVLIYRLQTRMGWRSSKKFTVEIPQGPFFAEVKKQCDLPVSRNWQNEALYFGWWPRPIGDGAPDWHQNPVNQKQIPSDKPWWEISDFDPETGDIKLIWEASRFSWVLVFSQGAIAGDRTAWNKLNEWLGDWCKNNPPYYGTNWKCGQEAAIRVMNLAMSSLLLKQTDHPAAGLVELIQLHMQRIASTIQYAISQDNNHGTSEAAALFIGGSWLAKLGILNGSRWEKQGRKWMENRVKRLVGTDGSFSQYSVNYHRVLLDTLSIVELWRKQLGLANFSNSYQSSAVAAVNWLAAVVDMKTGEAPNLGANDGACLLGMTEGNERDFRPSVQLAMVLFAGHRAYAEEGHWNTQLAWFEIPLPQYEMSKQKSQIFDDGGYAVLHSGEVMALMRYPRFRFRPSQADAMHVDLWKDGQNLLRDAGTFSYNTEQQWIDYFPGTVSHNTIQFDDRDQMPRLSRFLFGDWLKTESLEPLKEHLKQVSFAAAYRDYKGAYHKRRLMLTNINLVVTDEIGGFSNKAILRWRLSPGDWIIEGTSVSNGSHLLQIDASMPIERIAMVTGWESRSYMQKTAVPVLEIEFHQQGTIHSNYRWML